MIPVTPRRWSILLALWVGVLAAPASVARFDGVPFSSTSEVFALAVLLPIVCSSANRRLARRACAACPAWAAATIVGAVLCAGALKAVLATSRPSGFFACYQSTLSAPVVGGCERSFDNPFFRFAATRVDPVIDFGPADWNLSFVNSLRFNFYPWVRGLRRSDRLPLKIAWRGVVDSGPQDAAVIYVGEGSIGVDAATIELPRAYDAERTIPLAIAPGRHVVRVYYSFDDGSVSGRRQQLGPYATFRLRVAGPGGTILGPLAAASPTPAIRAAAIVVDAAALAISIALLAFYAFLCRFQGRHMVAVAGAGAASWIAVRAFGLPTPVAATLATCALLFAVLRRNRSTNLLLAYAALLLVGTWAARDAHPHVGAVVYRSRGDDWLSYESFARTILETWSPQGGEPVFYMQPFFRYLRFAEHLLFGDADPLIDLFAWVALVWTILWAAATLLPKARIGRARTALFVLASALTLALAGSVTSIAMIRLSLSEHATWIFSAAAFPLLCSRSPRRWAVGCALLGAAIITRPNQAPAVFAIAATFLLPNMRRRSRAAWLAAAVLGAVCLLPLAHNLYYGGRAVMFTTTAGSPDTLGLPVSTLARISSDRSARGALMQVVRGLLFLPPWRSSIGNDDVRFVIHALQAVWLAALCLALGRSVPAELRILTCVPAVYLGVHVLYAVGNYYPRHIMAAYFAMGLVTMTIAANATEPRRREETKVNGCRGSTTARRG